MFISVEFLSRAVLRPVVLTQRGLKLTPEEVNIISAVAPTATINIIRNFEVVKKFKVSPCLESLL
jgi:aspartate carbamoyltransferase regulatory subunit